MELMLHVTNYANIPRDGHDLMREGLPTYCSMEYGRVEEE